METIILEKENSFISHFGHEHPLKPTNSPPRDHQNTLCSACNLNIIITSPQQLGNNNNIDYYYYTCKTNNNCPFYLHKVCHNMPKKTHHPSHPNHPLTLQKITSLPPNPSDRPSKCEACQGDIVAGCFYGCDTCPHLRCHVLCSALPLSVSVTCHTHALKLTFSPPYNFGCDVCSNPSGGSAESGWLYRCQICDFDAHLGCAIRMRKAQPLIDDLSSSSSSSKSSLIRVRRSVSSVDHYHSEVDEVMQLLTERFLLCHHNGDTDEIRGKCSDVVGPIINGQVMEAKKPLFLRQSPLTPVSEEPSITAASFQSSDACFSIDLARSYSGYDAKNRGSDNQANDGDHDHDQSTRGSYNSPKVEGSRSNNNPNISEPISSDVKLPHEKIKHSACHGNFGLGTHNYYSFNMGRDERLKEAFLVRNDTLAREEFLGQKGKKGKISESKGKSKTISPTDKSGGSSWQKRLMCFCHTT